MKATPALLKRGDTGNSWLPADVLGNRRWWFHRHPFPHYRAQEVFDSRFYTLLEDCFAEILSRGLSEGDEPQRFSRNMPNSDAFAWNFPRDIDGPLAFFYSRDWHDLLASLLHVDATGDVNAALHHHQAPSEDGTIHRDLGVGWFSTDPRADGINPMNLRRCSYTTGKVYESDVIAREVVRAITMIFYLGNRDWSQGDGGETGLYEHVDAPIGGFAALVPPLNNSILLFENTPISFHSFLRNLRTRNSLILWLHRTPEDVANRWSNEGVYRWT